MFNKDNTKVPIIGIIQNMSYFISESNERHFIFGENGGEQLAKTGLRTSWGYTY